MNVLAPACIGLLATAPLLAQSLQWRQLPPLPDAHGFAGMFAGVCGNALLAAGGANFPQSPPWDGGAKAWHDTIWVLPSMEGKWQRSPTRLPKPVAYGVSCTVGPRLICMGGETSDGYVADVWALQLTDGQVTIEVLPAMPVPVAFACGAVVGETIYVAGGLHRRGDTSASKRFFALDLSHPPERWAWRELAPWPGPARHLAVAAANNGEFYLMSGIDLEADGSGHPRRITPYLRDVFRYRPDRGWQALPAMPRPAAAAPWQALALTGTSLTILGGLDGSLADIPVTEHPGFHDYVLQLDVSTGKWHEAAPMPRGVSRVTAPVTRWGEWWVIPSGERAPGQRSADVWAVRASDHFHHSPKEQRQ